MWAVNAAGLQDRLGANICGPDSPPAQEKHSDLGGDEQTLQLKLSGL